MRRARLAFLAGLAALIVGALPASAGGNDWGKWTFTGKVTSWSGTFVDSHHVTGFVLGTRARKRYNSITSFTIGGHTCKLSDTHGDAYCYSVDIPANTKLNWKATTKNKLRSSKRLVPCIEYSGKFHCRYGNN